jgi:hypothetical protein
MLGGRGRGWFRKGGQQYYVVEYWGENDRFDMYRQGMNNYFFKSLSQEKVK